MWRVPRTVLAKGTRHASLARRYKTTVPTWATVNPDEISGSQPGEGFNLGRYSSY